LETMLEKYLLLNRKNVHVGHQVIKIIFIVQMHVETTKGNWL